jgi:hypothetical protein
MYKGVFEMRVLKLILGFIIIGSCLACCLKEGKKNCMQIKNPTTTLVEKGFVII